MGRQVKGGSAAQRILQVLAERYPVTAKEVALALGLRPDVVMRELRRLRAQGLVVLEPLGTETYATLSGEGIQVVGLTSTQAADLRRRQRERRPPPPKPRPDDDPAFL